MTQNYAIPWFAAAILNGAYRRYNGHQARLAAVPQADPSRAIPGYAGGPPS